MLYSKLLRVEDALKIILNGVSVIDTISLPLEDALGHVIAQDLEANISHPQNNRSMMDGYAVRRHDLHNLPHQFHVIEEIPAGQKPLTTLAAFETARVYTGSMLPDGADQVVIQENTSINSSSHTHITINRADLTHDYISYKGEDFQQGDKILPAGTKLHARSIALASAMNYQKILVKRKPRIGLLCTGDELCMPNSNITVTQTINSNYFYLKAFIENHGGVLDVFHKTPDHHDVINKAFDTLSSCDVIVTTGGASVGDYDLVRHVLNKRKYTECFHGIAMRPGKPLFFGHLDHVPLLGLPGNPVSTAVCAEIFLKPIIAKLTNNQSVLPSQKTAYTNHAIGQNGHRQSYLRATIHLKPDGSFYADSPKNQHSAHLLTLHKANGLIIRPIHAPALKKGDKVPFIFFSDSQNI